jgi:hypothetical protein
MPGVQFTNQLDINGFKVTEMAPGTNGTDSVNLDQLNAASPQGFADSIGDGVATTFTVTHNFNTLDVITTVYEVASGNYILADARVASVNTVEVTFGSAPTTDQYRVLVVPVP